MLVSVLNAAAYWSYFVNVVVLQNRLYVGMLFLLYPNIATVFFFFSPWFKWFSVFPEYTLYHGECRPITAGFFLAS